MDYDSLKTSAIKSMLIEIMEQKKGIDYTLGWLKQSYCYPTCEDIERVVALKELKSLMGIKENEDVY